MANDAERLAYGERDFVFGGLNALSGDLVCPAGVVAEDSDGASDIGALCPVERLADIECLNSSEFIPARLNEVCELVEEAAALIAWAVQAPGRLERLLCCLDGNIDVLACEDVFRVCGGEWDVEFGGAVVRVLGGVRR